MSIFRLPNNEESMPDLFHQEPTFEDLGQQNGITFWWASDFMQMLGYSSEASFKQVINKAKAACLAINIDCDEGFISAERELDGQIIRDYKLSRFACYMVAMNADSKKPNVAAAQVYFAHAVEELNLLLKGADDIARLEYREEIKGATKALNSAASSAGVTNFAIFTDSGYRGLYNMSGALAASRRGVEPGKLLDRMGKAELSANLFRATMTEARLKREGVKSETLANHVHNSVGKEVREMVIKNTGVAPENLPIERPINEVGKALKQANKQLTTGKGKK